MSMAKLLLVDDEIDILEPLAFNLENLGYETLLAESGHEALDLITKHSFQAIISDVKMPNGDGVELLKSMKEANPSGPSLSFITGDSGLTLKEALHLGACQLLAKPFDFDELQDRIVWNLTPRYRRWQQPPKQAPQLSLKGFEAAIGAGGLSMTVDIADWHDCPAAGHPCQFATQTSWGLISGVARAVWHCSDSRRIGLEFIYLSDPCRAVVLEEMSKNLPVPYIPIM